MLRVIREIQPDYVVAENVRGLVTWNEGMVFNEVQADLEASGYEVTPFLLPAAGVNAPHQRYRVWFVAHAPGNSRRHGIRNEGYGTQPVSESRSNEFIDVANTEAIRMEGNRENWKQKPQTPTGKGVLGCNDTRNDWSVWPTQPPVCTGNDGIPGKLDSITVSKWRKEALKALGNSIVPQVAYQIFQAIIETEITKSK